MRSIRVCAGCGTAVQLHFNSTRCAPCQRGYKNATRRATRHLTFAKRQVYYHGKREQVAADNRANVAERTEYMRRYRAQEAKRDAINANARRRRESDTVAQAKMNASSSEWRAMKLQAMPNWLTAEQVSDIAAVYAAAKVAGLHVDHIVPLRGKTVWGLHVPWNLQLLTRSENCRKSNKLGVAA